tara:strand:+ start:913 stop:1710 length:798 start_codon:yes stop_codon:yes gene_type:complete
MGNHEFANIAQSVKSRDQLAVPHFSAVALHPVKFADEYKITLHSGLPLAMRCDIPVPHVENPTYGFQLLVKRVFDLFASVLGLALLTPLFLLVAVAIRLESRGPVFFKQPREGLDGGSFTAFKFRSMRIDECDETGINHTRSGDPRITKVGRFLRSTSIDELPQLINVIRGDMSIVGPRPHVPNMMSSNQTYRNLVSYYDYRLAMKPGITGWAQANGYRGDASDPALARARVDHDLAYIQNFSVLLDLRIIAKTVVQEFLRGTGS